MACEGLPWWSSGQCREPGLIPCLGTRSHMLQLKRIMHATTKTPCSQKKQNVNFISIKLFKNPFMWIEAQSKLWKVFWIKMLIGGVSEWGIFWNFLLCSFQDPLKSARSVYFNSQRNKTSFLSVPGLRPEDSYRWGPHPHCTRYNKKHLSPTNFYPWKYLKQLWSFCFWND